MNSPLRSLVLLLVLSSAFLAGCRRPATPASSGAAPSPAVAPVDQFHHPEGGPAVVAQTKYFKGSIGNSLDLQMKLVRTGDQLNGSYSYEKVGTKIDLRGTVDKDGNLSLEEFNSSGKQTGLFKGVWNQNGADGLIAIAGNWSKPPSEKGGDKKTAFSLHEEPIELTGEVEFSSKQIKENNKKSKYEVTAQYPQFAGGNNPNIEKFNQAARSLVVNKVAEFKKDMAEIADTDPPTEESIGSDITIQYTVSLVQDSLASIKFDISSYYRGAAHPNSYTEVLNYDLKNGKQLKLSDLFKPGAKYLQTLSTYAIADLKKQSKSKDGMLDDDSIQSGAGPTAKNYQSWTINKKGIVINFDPYQVGPYAAGPQEVFVPYSAVKDLVNPEGPVGQFVK